MCLNFSLQHVYISVYNVSTFQHDVVTQGMPRRQAVRLSGARLQETLQKRERHQIPRETRTQEGYTVWVFYNAVTSALCLRISPMFSDRVSEHIATI